MPGNITSTQNIHEQDDERTPQSVPGQDAYNEEDPSAAPLEEETDSNDPTDPTSSAYRAPSTPGRIEDLPTLKFQGLDEMKSNLKGLSPKALKTRAEILKEESVGFVIPLDPLEKPGAYESLTINGWTVRVRKGTFVRLPWSLAKLAADSHQVTMEALMNHPTNLQNPESALNPGMSKEAGGIK